MEPTKLDNYHPDFLATASEVLDILDMALMIGTAGDRLMDSFVEMTMIVVG